MADVKTLVVRRNGDVYLDGVRLGYVVRNSQRLYEAFSDNGRVVTDRADRKSTAVILLARRAGAIRVGDEFRISGAAATGGPWTVGYSSTDGISYSCSVTVNEREAGDG